MCIHKVVDINEVPPSQALQMCSLLPGITWRVLVCGGDGTVGWVLAVLDELSPPLPPHVAILPLGTGNDLARVLGWGKGYESEDIGAILSDIEHSQLSLLDRWNISIQPQRYLGIKRSSKVGGAHLQDMGMYTLNIHVGIKNEQLPWSWV